MQKRSLRLFEMLANPAGIPPCVGITQLAARCPTPAVRRRTGFTLIELLMVLLILGVLLGLISGGILYAVENTRRNRDNATRLTLRTALQTYRHEYGDWPLPDTGTGPFTDDNYQVFNRLLRDHSANKKGITFLEQGRFMAVDGDGERNRWSDCVSSDCALVNPWGKPYTVTVNLDADTVRVE